jgi:hypothetical protein
VVARNKDRDAARREELERQAAEEVARLTRQGGPPGGPAGMGAGGHFQPPSPLEMMAEQVAGRSRPTARRTQAARPAPSQAFTPLPTGAVGSSFGPGGLNPGPRGMGMSPPPPPAFGGGAVDEDYYDDDGGGGGRGYGGPAPYDAEPDEDEEMSVTEMALMDHAARTGHSPEDLMMRHDAASAEEMREQAMRAFYERMQSRGSSGPTTDDPFAPAGRRGPRAGGGGAAVRRRAQDPAAAGGALAQRLAARRRQEEQARKTAEPKPAPATPRAATAEPAAPKAAAPKAAPAGAVEDEGALSRLLARRRQQLLQQAPEEAPEAVPEEVAATEEVAANEAPGRLHAEERRRASPDRGGARLAAVPDADQPPPAAKAARAAKPAKATAGAKAAKTSQAAKAAKGATAKAPRAEKAVKAKARPVKGRGAASAAGKAAPAKRAKKAAARDTVFCIECGERNPAVAKFCLACGTRLATPG